MSTSDCSEKNNSMSVAAASVETPPIGPSLPETLYLSCLPSIFGTPPTSDSGLRVEPNGLYILLWTTGFRDKYHWALLLAQSATTGIIFHQTTVFWDEENDTQENKKKNLDQEPRWQFVAEPLNVSNSPGLLCALKVGMLEDAGSEEWVDAAKQCVRASITPSTPPPDPAYHARDAKEKVEEEKINFSCRIWILVALFELANGGFIGMVADREKIEKTIEKEARRLAKEAELLGVEMVTVSEMCMD